MCGCEGGDRCVDVMERTGVCGCEGGDRCVDVKEGTGVWM